MHIQYRFLYICICFFYHNKSNEITSLWPVFIIYIITYIFVVSSRRNKTNPHHRNKFIPVLNTTHVQAFKPKLSTYDQLLKTDQQDVSLYMCVRKLKHFQPHSLLCHLWCIFYLQYIRLMWYLYMIIIWKKLTKQLRQTSFFFSSYTIYFTLLINCMNTVILTEQSLHHNIILEKLDHCWVNRICTKNVISESHTTSLLHI